MGGDHHAATSPDATQRRSVKWCELCKLPANLYCPSDEASLCWQCDAQIHSANFLVARHCRTLLCYWCGDPISTYTLQCGPRIEPRLQFCRHCVHRGGGRSTDGKEGLLSSSESCCIAGPDEASCESSIVQHREACPRQRSLKRKRSILAAADAGERPLPKEGFGDSEDAGAHHDSNLPSSKQGRVNSAHRNRKNCQKLLY